MTANTERNLSSETPLESWKEVAAYLQRDVRTVIRWEKKEGLPVHRHHHLSRSSVYAYQSELDAWRVNRKPLTESTRSGWRRPMPAFASTVVIALSLIMVGSGPQVGTLVQAADGIVSRQVWVGADGAGTPSPDGKYITTVDWKSGNLAIRNVETQELRILTTEASWQEPRKMAGLGALWSRDGKSVAYFWSGPDELRILDIDNPQPRVLFRAGGRRYITPIQFTPDGLSILATTYRPGQEGEIVMIRNGSSRLLATVPQNSFHASLSPDGRFLVFDRAPDGDFPARDLYIKPMTGGDERRLVAHPADDSLLGWVPGSEWVLFVSDRTGSSSIYAVPVQDGNSAGEPILIKDGVGRINPMGFTRDGSFYYALVKAARDVYTMEIDPETGKVVSAPQKAILHYEGSNMFPRYSPDGKYLAYISKRGNAAYPTNRGNALALRSLKTGEERVFFKEFANLRPRYLIGPSWYPDSEQILIGIDGGTGYGLYALNVKSGKIAEVVKFPEGVGSSVYRVSPDGRSIVYVLRDFGRQAGRIVRRDLASGEEREIRGDDVSNISLSPDGRWIAFSNSGFQKQLQIMPAEGGKPRLLYRFRPFGYGVPHTWTPDGKYILFTTGANHRTLCRIPVAGGDVQRLWPDVLSLGPISAHPDGRHITFAAASEIDSAQDVWVMQNYLPVSKAAKQDGP